MTDTSKGNGRCLCKSVTLSTKSMSQDISACHCNMCRAWGGGPLMVVECGEDIIIDGAESVCSYSSSDWAERAFCKHCGTHLYYHLIQQNQYFIPVGLFDPQHAIPFTTEIFIDEKPDYYSFSNITKKLTGKEVFDSYTS